LFTSDGRSQQRQSDQAPMTHKYGILAPIRCGAYNHVQNPTCALSY
jgi:hypothetical protein